MPTLKRPDGAPSVELPPRQAVLAGETDVLVVGGGPAGLGAALGAKLEVPTLYGPEALDLPAAEISWDRAMEFIVEVPARTNLKLGLVNGGALLVENVDGDIETNNINGPSTTLTNVSGSVVANATNGKLVAVLTRVTAQKAMAFASLNGVVDVTLPASVRANVKLRSDQGDVFTDFDIQLTASKEQPAARDSRQSGGRYRLDIDRSLYGTINGGGPEFELRSFNGNVYLRRGK